MKVKALVSFAPADGPPVCEGDVFELPEGADYVAAGLCEPVDLPARKAAPKK